MDATTSRGSDEPTVSSNVSQLTRLCALITKWVFKKNIIIYIFFSHVLTCQLHVNINEEFPNTKQICQNKKIPIFDFVWVKWDSNEAQRFVSFLMWKTWVQYVLLNFSSTAIYIYPLKIQSFSFVIEQLIFSLHGSYHKCFRYCLNAKSITSTITTPSHRKMLQLQPNYAFCICIFLWQVF